MLSGPQKAPLLRHVWKSLPVTSRKYNEILLTLVGSNSCRFEHEHADLCLLYIYLDKEGQLVLLSHLSDQSLLCSEY